MRRSMVAAMLFLLGFVLIRVTLYVNMLQGGNALEPTGWPLLFAEFFYITAAGLGASFAVLFEVNQYTLKAAFDPSYEPFYWTRFALGLIAGVLLAEMVPDDSGKPLYHGVAKPTLALLGGFSASVVYQILVRLRNTLEAFILPGSNNDFTPQESTVRGAQPDTWTQDRLKVVARLIALQKRLESGANPEQLKQEMDCLVAELMVADEEG